MAFSGIPRRNAHRPSASKSSTDWDIESPPSTPAADGRRETKAQGLEHNNAQPQGFQIFGVDQRVVGLGHEDGVVCSCAYSLDGQYLAVGLDSRIINVYRTSNWEWTGTLRGHTGAIWSVAYSPTGDRIASASQDKTVIVWDSGSRSVLRKFEHADGVRCVAFSPCGNQVASASDDQTVKLWETATGNCVQTIPDHKDGATCVAYSPNRKQVASGCRDNKVRLWDAGGRSSLELSGHTQAVMDVKYSPKGDLLASASEDRTVRLWNVTKRECSYILKGHENGVLSVAFWPNGDQLVSGGRDRAVRVWGTKKGSSIRTLTGHNGLVMSVAYSPTCKQVASGSTDKTVRLWNLDLK
ncbi:MAG: WD40-repeat-containing domain protein [Benniella sp.]|nr:MAG: WD40-repeat-containing domain protein [Benniella sp.]